MSNRRLVHDLLGQERRPFIGRCGYCGVRCYGKTCASHRDLPQLEHDTNPTAAPPGTPAARTKGA